MHTDNTRGTGINRRRFLTWSAATLALASAPIPLVRAAKGKEHRRLAFHNLHTGEKLDVTYWERGDYLPDALGEVNHVLRDHRANEVHPIDPDLLDTLDALQKRLDTKATFEVISGYRSPETNRRLRAQGRNVAVYSLHMEGEAIDIRVPGRGLAQVRDAAQALRKGGVGYYPRSQFVHVDIGDVRSW
ncbi:uncharacterized protein YcbK (DUF882 family) [Alkalispirillum mobile]|uniref:Murein endopeptidase K n=1 Tax=Alkalispirillum mobile TaxID=85925 RepID=A0A498C6R6_9GAMM|nr:DUF882 domain-containing protein [Alkalispirillum mobile]RLK48790.1 uncharacterized protein YcbK (DUF882 family) [Alkalispirillum mobile]